MSDIKIKEIDDKIKFLKEKKSQLEEKKLKDLSRLLVKLGIAEWDYETLVGALLSLKDSPHKEVWHKTGKTFLQEQKNSRKASGKY